MSKIKKIVAREVLDSRGFPTVEADVILVDGSFGRAAVPSGASTGSHEAVELRDGGKRYLGKGVTKAVKNVEKISKKIIGMDADDIRLIDDTMIALDSTDNKGKLGANAILAVSMAVLRAGAVSNKKPLYQHLRNVYSIKNKQYLLPAPLLNIINGGQHSDAGIDVQEFMVIPTKATNFKSAMSCASEIYHSLKKLLASKKYTVSVGDEGGFAPKITKHENVLKTILTAVANAGYRGKTAIALDCAASEFYKAGKYKFEGKKINAEKLTDIYASWCKKFPIISIEDPLHEDDWKGWKYMTKKLGKKITIVGDDLFVTNPTRLERGIKEKSANSILIKLNQIGSVSETIDVIDQAHNAGFSTIISHRSGETSDSFIADLAVATNAGAIKTGAPCRSERLSKYNRLLQIEEELGKKAKYAKDKIFKK